MSNAFHRRYKELTQAIRDSSPPRGATGGTGGSGATAGEKIHAAVSAEVASALAKVEIPENLPEQLSRLKTGFDALSLRLSLSELTRVVEGWAHNNFKQQNDRRRELCAAMDRPLVALIGKKPESVRAWEECKQDLPKNSNADSLRDRQNELYDHIAEIQSALRAHT
ncbi:MAG TPA: hypothetical protein VER11_31650 [Polyangiaceae bacterium]|nr:hypothetical protein [Polyangiaceae bacterium]